MESRKTMKDIIEEYNQIFYSFSDRKNHFYEFADRFDRYMHDEYVSKILSSVFKERAYSAAAKQDIIQICSNIFNMYGSNLKKKPPFENKGEFDFDFSNFLNLSYSDIADDIQTIIKKATEEDVKVSLCCKKVEWKFI